MPAIGYGIGTVVHFLAKESSVEVGLMSAVFAFVASMLTHVPKAYAMFRSDFGTSAVWGILLSLVICLKYPLQATMRFPLYGLVLVLTLAAAYFAAF